MVQQTCACRPEIGRNILTNIGPNPARKPAPHEKPGPTYKSVKTGILLSNSIFKLIVFLTRALSQTWSLKPFSGRADHYDGR